MSCEQRGSERIAVLEQLLEEKGDGRSSATATTTDNATLLERHLHSNRKMTQVLLYSYYLLLLLEQNLCLQRSTTVVLNRPEISGCIAGSL
jgi:hypothetical protein